MGTHYTQPQAHFMNSFSSKLNSVLFLSSPVTTRFTSFLCTHASSCPSQLQTPRRTRSNASSRNSLKASDVAMLKENWLDSLSSPLQETYFGLGMDSSRCSASSDLVLGIDPDVSGALALLKIEESSLSAQGMNMKNGALEGGVLGVHLCKRILRLEVD